MKAELTGQSELIVKGDGEKQSTVSPTQDIDLSASVKYALG